MRRRRGWGIDLRVLVCGGRNWTDGDTIYNVLSRLAIKPTLLIEGEARGADSLARLAAEKLGVPVQKFPAKWKQYGRAAGYIRNKQMLDEGKPDMVIAFHNDIDTSKGTKMMVELARKAGVTTVVYGGPC